MQWESKCHFVLGRGKNLKSLQEIFFFFCGWQRKENTAKAVFLSFLWRLSRYLKEVTFNGLFFFSPAPRVTILLVYPHTPVSVSSRVLTWLWCFLGRSRSSVHFSHLGRNQTLLPPFSSEEGDRRPGWLFAGFGSWCGLRHGWRSVSVCWVEKPCDFQIALADVGGFSMNYFFCTAVTVRCTRDLGKCSALACSLRPSVLKCSEY